MHDFAFPIGLP